MSHVFVSHAAPDKLLRVKPLVHALALEGVKLWLDRPGAGDSHFNFDEAFLKRHDIRGLVLGVDWNAGIADALRASGAVLLCLSRTAVDPGRRVLRDEWVIAWYERRIVPCFVDDLPFDEVPADLGLADLSRQQAERVDPVVLQRCLDWLAAAPGRSADQLPADLAPQWQKVRKLRDDLAAVEQRVGQGRAPAGPSDAAQALLALLSATARPPVLLLRLYRRSLPDPARALASPSLAAMLRDLEELDARDPQLPRPLIEFAERLLREGDDPALRTWLATHTAGDRAAYLELQRRLDAPPAGAKATLFVDVDPEVQQQLRWWIHAADPAHCSAERTVPLDGDVPAALARCLGEALADAEASIGRECRIGVALLLPKALLGAGLESLPVPMQDDDESPPVRVGLQRRYPVTLHWRSRARARGRPGPRRINAWNQVLDVLLDRAASGAAANVAWVDPDPAAADDPFATAALRLRDVGDPAFCIGVGPAPAPQPLDEAIDACLREGVPCFFWFSRPPAAAGEAVRQAVGGEFARHKPCDAPLEVGQRCMSAGAASPFSSLCMVWDEPGHVHVPEPQTAPTDKAAP